MVAAGSPGDNGGNAPFAGAVLLHKGPEVDRPPAQLHQGQTLLNLVAGGFHFGRNGLEKLRQTGIGLLTRAHRRG
ncbi:hypothetical protein D3C75_1209980 [compost metagenome]